jgi:hypothetical protein
VKNQKKKKKKPNQHTLPPKHHKMLTEKEREGDREWNTYEW